MAKVVRMRGSLAVAVVAMVLRQREVKVAKVVRIRGSLAVAVV